MRDAFRGFRQDISYAVPGMLRLPAGVLALCLAAAAAGPAGAGQVHFLPDFDVTDAALGARTVVSVDIDQDGDLDLVLASINDHTVSWQENLSGDGSEWALHVIQSTFGSAWAVHAGDLDGDGDNDVVATAFSGNLLSWFENLDGDGSNWAQHVIRNTDVQPTAVHITDVDGDGDLDLVSAALGFDTVFWHENQSGDGSSWLTRLISSAHADPRSIGSADFDKDGDMDLVVAYSLSDRVVWFENTAGTGTSWTGFNVGTQILFANSVHTEDLDQDGDEDIMVTAANDDAVLWFENVGVNFLWNWHQVSGLYRAPSSIHSADLDQDGDLDVVSASANDDSIVFHENLNGAATQWAPHVISSVANEARSVGARDLDGDGDVDAFSASIADNRVAWYENNNIHRNARFPLIEPIPSPQVDPSRILAHEIDGDGTIDLVTIAADDGTVVLHRNPLGDGLNWTSSSLPVDVAASSACAGDVNGDGRIDLFIASESEGALSWLVNDGAAWSSFGISTTVTGVEAVLAADLDRDGDLDAVTVSPASSALDWHENLSGVGSHWSTHAIPTTRNQPGSVRLADVDGDADLDVLAAFTGDDMVAWYENDGASTWTEHIVSAARVEAVMAVADLDRDGDVDILSTSTQGSALVWHENLGGSGVAWQEHTVPSTLGGRRVRDLALLDLDGDGDFDAVSRSEQPDRAFWHENPGGGGAWKEVSILDAGVTSVVAADLDGNGRLDLIATASGSQALGWYPNLGGQFGLRTRDMAPPAPAEGGTYGLLAVEVGHNGRVGDTALQLESLALRLEDAVGAPLESADAAALLESLSVYRDDGSGSFEAGTDLLVHTVSPVEPLDGALRVDWSPGDPVVEVGVGETATFFLVASFTADAATHNPNTLRLIHEPESGSAATQVLRSIPLGMEHSPAAASTAVPLGVDDDLDGVSILLDCDDLNPLRFPGAPEINDGMDNQCPGDPGHGSIDELSGSIVFEVGSSSLLAWPSQGGAAFYQAARSGSPDFSGDCFVSTQWNAHWQDPAAPPRGSVFYYLVRPLTPYTGSWGRRPSGEERSVECPWTCDRRVRLKGVTACP